MYVKINNILEEYHMGIIDKIFGSEEAKKLYFVKPFEKDNCRQKEQLEDLLLKVGDDQKEVVERELNKVNIGLAGESKVAYELENIYSLYGFVFHDVCLKYNEITLQYDFIIVTQRFICVIEAKKLNGNIDIDKEGNFIRTFIDAKGNVYKKEGMDSPVEQNKKHCNLLEQLLTSNKLIKNFPILSLICCSNSKAIIKKAYAPREIQEIVIKTDQLANKLLVYYNSLSDFEIKKKQMMNIIDYISDHIVERDIDYVSKLKLKLMATKFEEKTIETAPNTKEIVREEVVVEVPQNDDLYEELRKYRKTKSEELNYKPYYIFNNEQLEKLILKRPLDLNELSKSKILNAKQYELYGQDILDIIIKHSKIEFEKKSKLEASPLYQKLKAFRYAKANEENIPQYYIFTNAELIDIVEKCPSTKEELLKINGIGNKKVELYGNEILKIVKMNR